MAKKYHRDTWVGLVLLCFCAFFLINALQIPGEAAYLPIALSVLMALCALFITLKGLRLTREQNGDFKYPLEAKKNSM